MAKKTEVQEAQEVLDGLQVQRQEITDKIAALNQEILSVPLGDIGDAVIALETLETQIKAYRTALSKLDGKIAEARIDLQQAVNAERALLAKDEVAKRDKVTMETIQKLRELQALLDDLDTIRADLLSQYKVHSPDVFQPQLREQIDFTLKQRASFFPELFGLPAKPTRQQRAIISEQLNLERQIQLLEDLKKQEGKPNSKVTRDRIAEQQENVYAAQRRLARLKGEPEPDEHNESGATVISEIGDLWTNQMAKLRQSVKGGKK